ncbi:MAG: TorF family putative porin [Bdellovibrionota bacterium]|nr:TorF family putative porin [Bdellovibrionota bacterium]
MKITFLVLSLLTLFPLIGQAGGETKLSVTSEYIWRGTRLSNGAAAQAELTREIYHNLEVGLFASNVSEDISERDSEADLHLVQFFDMDDKHRFGIGVIGYLYLTHTSHNTTEAHISYENPWFNLKAYNTQKYFGKDTGSTYLNVGTKIPVGSEVFLRVNLGQTTYENEVEAGYKNYSDYKVSFEKEYQLGVFDLFFSSANRYEWDGTTKTKKHDDVLGVTFTVEVK